MAPQGSKSIYEALGRHAVHPFPARMAPGIALDILAKAKTSMRVLDPMMGSGTVLAVAQSKGHEAIGFDVDPLAVLISKVWTARLDDSCVRRYAELVLKEAQGRYKSLRSDDAFPTDADEETKAFARYWFDHFSRRQLSSLAESIRVVPHLDARDALWCAFSRLIIAKSKGSSLAMDLAHSRPHKAYRWAPAKPFENFCSAVEHVIANSAGASISRDHVPAQALSGDARRLPVDTKSIDLIITSPPYLNAIDYLRCSKFSLIWMQSSIDELRAIRASSVGAESKSDDANQDELVRRIMTDLILTPPLKSRHNAMLARYVLDLRLSLEESARVLKGEGRAVYVVGENTIRGTFIPTSKIVETVAKEVGLELKKRYSRELPQTRRYLPPPTRMSNNAGMDGRMRREVVLSFVKRQ
jgi:tRNA G10  N-methylase Trm11